MQNICEQYTRCHVPMNQKIVQMDEPFLYDAKSKRKIIGLGFDDWTKSTCILFE